MLRKILPWIGKVHRVAAASYIADALITSDDFDWDAGGVADAIFRLSDESAPLTQNDLDWVADRIALGS